MHSAREKRTMATTKNEDITCCDNVQCPSHTNCLRWQMWKDGGKGFLYAFTFAPASKHSQKCRFFKKA